MRGVAKTRLLQDRQKYSHRLPSASAQTGVRRGVVRVQGQLEYVHTTSCNLGKVSIASRGQSAALVEIAVNQGTESLATRSRRAEQKRPTMKVLVRTIASR